MSRHASTPDRYMRTLLFGMLLPLSGCTQWYYDLGAPLPLAYEEQAAGLTLAQVMRDLGPPLRYAVRVRACVPVTCVRVRTCMRVRVRCRRVCLHVRMACCHHVPVWRSAHPCSVLAELN